MNLGTTATGGHTNVSISPDAGCISQPNGDKSLDSTILDLDFSTDAAVTWMQSTFIDGWVLTNRGYNYQHSLPTSSKYPQYLSGDAYYGAFGSRAANYPADSLTCVPVGTWNNGISNETQFQAMYKNFFDKAAANHPEFRLGPHGGGLSPQAWPFFQSTYANVPFLVKEPFQLSELSDVAHKSIYYQIFTQYYWFANIAPQVFPTVTGQNPVEPPSRVIFWGADAGNATPSQATLHTELAAYLMTRGPNSFFELLQDAAQNVHGCPNSSCQFGVLQRLWKPALDSIGSVKNSSGVKVTVASGHNAVDGYNWYERDYPGDTTHGGVAYMNMSGANVTIPIPRNSFTWDCTNNPCVYTPAPSSITLSNGQGEVILHSTTPTTALIF